ncbi:hypothetical protein PDIDSM_8749 [Penicillium digitatum]|nr:hypothetical protein PDIDSM_8749 [Penicillium digitatum]
MECPRQIFRCLKAPLRRDKGKIIEIDGYVPGQSHTDRGERQHDDQNGSSTIVDERQGAGPCSKDERETVPRFRDRVKLHRWWKLSPVASYEIEASAKSIKVQEM